ncbi:MAG: hypothetical protein ACI9G1_000703 [Pirellulaceae bacterium]|jgi:hypothetical protein
MYQLGQAESSLKLPFYSLVNFSGLNDCVGYADSKY